MKGVRSRRLPVAFHWQVYLCIAHHLQVWSADAAKVNCVPGTHHIAYVTGDGRAVPGN